MPWLKTSFKGFSNFKGFFKSSLLAKPHQWKLWTWRSLLVQKDRSRIQKTRIWGICQPNTQSLPPFFAADFFPMLGKFADPGKLRLIKVARWQRFNLQSDAIILSIEFLSIWQKPWIFVSKSRVAGYWNSVSHHSVKGVWGVLVLSFWVSFSRFLDKLKVILDGLEIWVGQNHVPHCSLWIVSCLSKRLEWQAEGKIDWGKGESIFSLLSCKAHSKVKYK